MVPLCSASPRAMVAHPRMGQRSLHVCTEQVPATLFPEVRPTGRGASQRPPPIKVPSEEKVPQPGRIQDLPWHMLLTIFYLTSVLTD